MKKVIDLQYGWHKDFFTGHITRIKTGLYRAMLEANGRKIGSRDMNEEQFQMLIERMEEVSSSPQIEFDWNSIWPLNDFVFPEHAKDREIEREKHEFYDN